MDSIDTKIQLDFNRTEIATTTLLLSTFFLSQKRTKGREKERKKVREREKVLTRSKEKKCFQ